ncbi:MAG: hypothetical protein WDN49_03640 [Acetobacteraceae bacterium]
MFCDGAALHPVTLIIHAAAHSARLRRCVSPIEALGNYPFSVDKKGHA